MRHLGIFLSRYWTFVLIATISSALVAYAMLAAVEPIPLAAQALLCAVPGFIWLFLLEEVIRWWKQAPDIITGLGVQAWLAPGVVVLEKQVEAFYDCIFEDIADLISYVSSKQAGSDWPLSPTAIQDKTYEMVSRTKLMFEAEPLQLPDKPGETFAGLCYGNTLVVEWTGRLGATALPHETAHQVCRFITGKGDADHEDTYIWSSWLNRVRQKLAKEML
jgi:hypothetical protein